MSTSDLEAEHIAAATGVENPSPAPEQAIETEGFTGVDPVLHDAATAKIATLETALATANAEITALKTSLYDKMAEAASAPQADDPQAEALGDEDPEADPDAPTEYDDLFDDEDN